MPILGRKELSEGKSNQRLLVAVQQSATGYVHIQNLAFEVRDDIAIRREIEQLLVSAALVFKRCAIGDKFVVVAGQFGFCRF